MLTLKQFKVGLYREYLEEASFLYDQRLTRLRSPEVCWPDLTDLEERFEAQIDALIVGGDLARQTCRLPADAGEIHAALCLYCREDAKADAFALLNELDPTDEPAVSAAALAFRFQARAEWRPDLVALLQSDRTHLIRVGAQVAGFRRYPSESLLAARLAANPPFGAADLAWALGRVGTARSAPLLSSVLDSDDERIAEAAAVALLRLGDQRVLERAMLFAPGHTWARRVLAIAGDARSVSVLLDILNGSSQNVDTVLALGLLGDLVAVAPLVQLLEDDALGEAAAVALNTITGADLYADRFVPDIVDPDELLDDEREELERQGTLLRLDGRPYGAWEHVPLRDPGRWREWLKQNKSRFNRDLRWRMGEQYGPSALLACLRCPKTPYDLRRATSDELVARYRMDVPFEVELRVHQQLRFLSKIESWTTANSSKYEKGRAYFAGQPQT